jgi:hypothetical protein
MELATRPNDLPAEQTSLYVVDHHFQENGRNDDFDRWNLIAFSA